MQKYFQKYSSEVKKLSNQQLLSQTKFLVQKERNLHIQVLHHLEEIDSRKLYLEQGFSRLFDYAVKELGYSEGAAYRRIKAMKLCREVPETESRLKSGRLSLSAACQLQAFFEKQDKRAKKRSMRKKTITSAEKLKSKNININDKQDPKNAIKNSTITSAPKWKYAGRTKKLSRAIPAELKRHIWKRDGGQCSYVHPETKRRCSSKHLLQIDHVKPFSLGGRSELNNLRLLCAGHNRYRSERTFRL